jgi:hypothetical protein
MDTRKVIGELEKAKAPSKFLDSQIAQAIGWTRSYGEPDGNGKQEVNWTPPGETKPAKFPNFTSSLNDAYLLALSAYPDVAVGVRWDDAGGSCHFEDDTPCTGPTPALAVCIAVLNRMLRDSSNDKGVHFE